MSITLDVICDSCRDIINEDEDIYCVACSKNIEEVNELETRIDDLNNELSATEVERDFAQGRVEELETELAEATNIMNASEDKNEGRK